MFHYLPRLTIQTSSFLVTNHITFFISFIFLADAITAVHEDPNAPWVYREDFQPKRWPPSRAEMPTTTAVIYGEYIRLLPQNSNCATTQSDDNEQQHNDGSDDPHIEEQAVCDDQENPENKVSMGFWKFRIVDPKLLSILMTSYAIF